MIDESVTFYSTDFIPRLGSNIELKVVPVIESDDSLFVDFNSVFVHQSMFMGLDKEGKANLAYPLPEDRMTIITGWRYLTAVDVESNYSKKGKRQSG